MPRNGNAYILIIAVLGIAKLTFEALGYSFITIEKINEFANYGAAIAAIVGVWLNNRKPPTDGQNKVTNINTFTPKD